MSKKKLQAIATIGLLFFFLMNILMPYINPEFRMLVEEEGALYAIFTFAARGFVWMAVAFIVYIIAMVAINAFIKE